MFTIFIYVLLIICYLKIGAEYIVHTMDKNTLPILIIEDLENIANMQTICKKLELGSAYGVTIAKLECSEECIKK